MKMKVSLLIVFLLGCAGSAESVSQPHIDLAIGEPHRVIKDDEWELHIWYQNMGSRSEGQHGVLFHQDDEVSQSTVGEEVVTSLGLMRNYGPKPEGIPWSQSGWNYADQDRILRSWQLELSE